MLDQPNHPVSDSIPSEIVDFCSLNQAYLPNARTDTAFISAMRAVTALHIERSPWYRRFAAARAIDPGSIQTMDDVLALPPLHANFFKAHEIRSIPLEQVTLHLTSSGTSGQKSQIFFDAFTIEHARAMVDAAMLARDVVSKEPAHYLVNAYEPYEGFRVGTSNTNQYLMNFAPVADQFWTLRRVGSSHEFDCFGAIRALSAWAQSDTPVRIIGFPAFLHFILQRMRAITHPDLQLSEGSRVIFGGGWKGYADQAIDKAELHRDIGAQLGIKSRDIVETYGAVEHSIPYVDCPKHHLHQPTWSRVVVRDVRTLEPVADGTPGFLSFISPYITSAPAHSVVMGDLGIRHQPDANDVCPTPWFEILGRAGLSRNKSCAAAAAELLK
ncbi:MAG: acyl-protein synthase [Thermodesulfobacteriota bacterium]